jgi:maltose O-acetyltransferase
MADQQPKSFFNKVIWTVRNRPASIFSYGRQFVLFYSASLLRRLPGSSLPGVELGENVRLQKNSCLQADVPNATIRIGAHSVIYENAKIHALGKGRIELGEESILGDIRIACRYRVTIGKRFLSSWNVFIQDFDPHPLDPTLRGTQVSQMAQGMRPWFGRVPPRDTKLDPQVWNFPGADVSIGDDVWIGANATILKGARIGSGCIVAAGAVVLKGEYPDCSILGGNPAKLLKTLKQFTP